MSSYDNSSPSYDSESDGGLKLYVGGLDFSTDEDTLRQAFGEFGEVTDVFLPLDRMSQRPRGFAFVTLSNPENLISAQDIIQRMDQSELDGRMIKVSEPYKRTPNRGGYQQQGFNAAEFNAAGADEVKLYVGNIPFDTPEEDVVKMFEEFGTVSDCVFIRDRETQRPRGFGFITMPADVAEVACQQLNGQSLDGRFLKVNEAQPKKDRNEYGSERGGFDGGYGGGRQDGFDGGFGRNMDEGSGSGRGGFGY